MGFIAAGYCSRDFQDRFVEREKLQLCKRVGSWQHNSSATGKRRHKRHKAPHKHKPATITDLPSELIQRIFVFSGNYELYVVSKFFYMNLKPTSFLLHHYMLENFYHDLNENFSMADPDKDGEDVPCFHGLNGQIFDIPVFRSFLNENPHLLQDIGHIGHHDELEQVTKERQEMYAQGNLKGTSLMERHKEVQKQDYPAAFYADVELFFQNDIQLEKPIYNQFILELFAHYEIKQPYYLMENMIHWFFHVNNGEYNINHLFHAVILVTHISTVPSSSLESNGPLIELMNELYLASAGQKLNILLLMSDHSDEEAINNRRIRIISKFISKFYKDQDARTKLLSQDILWNTLRNLKNESLMKLIMEYGGQPSFSVI